MRGNKGRAGKRSVNKGKGEGRREEKTGKEERSFVASVID